MCRLFWCVQDGLETEILDGCHAKTTLQVILSRHAARINDLRPGYARPKGCKKECSIFQLPAFDIHQLDKRTVEGFVDNASSEKAYCRACKPALLIHLAKLQGLIDAYFGAKDCFA